MEELARCGDQAATKGRVILAHLGNGASLAAVRDGKSVDTSMSFTPTAGVPMSTRSGDLDPGLVWYLARTEKMNDKQFNEMVNFQSGLLGISETSSDMRDLLEHETQDVRAAEAVALFCYQVKKWIGAFAAALGGLDTLVFAGGIGENAAPVRDRICDGLGFLGIKLDEKRNAVNEGVISDAASRVAVRVIRTDEELMIAKTVARFSDLKKKNNLKQPQPPKTPKTQKKKTPPPPPPPPPPPRPPAAGRPTLSKAMSRKRCMNSWPPLWKRPSRISGKSKRMRGPRTTPLGRAGP